MARQILIDEQFQRDVTLSDGSVARLRLLRPSDREHLVEGIRKLSPLSRYRRFLSATTELPEESIRYLTETDNVNHLAVVALSPTEPGAGMGLARFVRQPGAKAAEAAVTVLDDYQGRGLGRLLLAALTIAARERGVELFRADILSTNAPMLTLLRELGAQVRAEREGEVLTVELPLPPFPENGDWNAVQDGEGGRLIRFAAQELQLLDKAAG